MPQVLSHILIEGNGVLEGRVLGIGSGRENTALGIVAA